MAAPIALETYKGRTITRTRDGLERTRVFFVETDDPDSDATAAEGLPARDEAFPGNGQLVVKRIHADHPGEQPRLWRITVDYGPREDSDEGSDTAGDPTDDTVKISGGSEFFLLALQRDFQGEAIVNSAKDPFDPPIEVEVARPYLQLEKNEAGAPYAKNRQYTNTVNTSSFYGAGSKTLLCADISFNNAFWTPPGTNEKIQYWVVRYKFIYNEQKWNPTKILDAGFRELRGGKAIEIKLDDNMTASIPMKLNADGTRADPASAPRFKDFTLYRETDFAGLGLGTG